MIETSPLITELPSVGSEEPDGCTTGVETRVGIGENSGSGGIVGQEVGIGFEAGGGSGLGSLA
jgi:hypothetical protein